MEPKLKSMLLLLFLVAVFSACEKDNDSSPEDPNENLPDISGYHVVGTNQNTFFNDINEIPEPVEGEDYFGQNAHHPGNTPSYTSNGDGTVTDNVTGLMWQNSFDHNSDGQVDYDDKLSYEEIISLLNTGVSFAGYNDWRLPTIKELYSLILFSGRDISGYEGSSTEGLIPFMDTDVFEFGYGDTGAGERLIDMQCATSTMYAPGTGFNNDETVFGVNFADGRIKGYATSLAGQSKMFNHLLVRGNTTYGINDFAENGDGTITDHATGLMWIQNDSGEGMTWKQALAYAEGKEFAGYSDWRLPDAKELQSIVDYSRSPDATGSAAIDQLFNCTGITNEAGQTDYPYYWTSTTHANFMDSNQGGWAAYFSFGRAMGNMNGWVDIHGAGAQRSDPKSGDPAEYGDGHGPQGDAVRIYNYVRLVRTTDERSPGF